MQPISVGVKIHRIYADIVSNRISLNCSQKGSNMLTKEREHNYDEAPCGSSLEKLSVTSLNGIYRQNHGFSHIVIGRKHADAPFFDGTAIWGDFDAQEVFENLGGELAISPVKVGFAAYYDSMGRVDLMSRHPDDKAFFISGTKVREMLVSGEFPPAKIMRKETAEILIGSYGG